MIQLFLRLHSAEYLLCCFRWLTVVGLSFGHLGAQYISVHPFYTFIRYARSIIVRCLIPFAQSINVPLFLYRLWLFFLLLTAYRLSVQSILIAYVYRCVQCTRYCCQHFLIFGKWALLSVLYLTLYRYADSVFLFFAYRNYLAVPLIWSL